MSYGSTFGTGICKVLLEGVVGVFGKNWSTGRENGFQGLLHLLIVVILLFPTLYLVNMIFGADLIIVLFTYMNRYFTFLFLVVYLQK